MLLLLACAILAVGPSAAGGPYRTPPMGWRSWEAFYGHVSQSRIETVMDAMVDTSRGGVSLLSLGYSDVGTDDGWQACHTGINSSFHDGKGNPLVNGKFPNLTAMAEKAHGLGLTAGFYMNNCGCKENQFTDPAMIDKIYERSVAAFVRWGFDSLKLDSCSQFNDMDKWTQLLNKSAARPVPLENCHQGGLVPGQTMPGQTCTPAADGSGHLDCPYTSFRVSDDIYNHWPFVINNVNAMVPYLDDPRAASSSANKPRLSRPGQWAYPDMLEVMMVVLRVRVVVMVVVRVRVVMVMVIVETICERRVHTQRT